MALTKIPVPSVAGGMTQRPPIMADPGRWDDLEDMVPLFEVGVAQRPYTRWRALVSEAPWAASRMFPVDLGGEEKYLAVVSQEKVQAFSRAGIELPVKEVTRGADGLITGGSDPDFSYLDLRRAENLVVAADDFAVASPGSGWQVDTLPGASVGDTTAINAGPDLPFRLTYASGANAYSALRVTDTGAASWAQEFNHNIYVGLTKFAVHVNTDTNSYFDAVCDRVTLSIGNPDGTPTRHQVTFDWNGDPTALPTVVTNSDNLAYTIERVEGGTYDYRLGIVLDGRKVATPAAFTQVCEVAIILQQGAASPDLSGINAACALFSVGGERDTVPAYLHSPEEIKGVTAVATTFLANPAIPTRIDDTVQATGFADVYPSATFSKTSGGGAGSVDESVADAAYLFVKQFAFETDYDVTVKLRDTESAATRTLTATFTTGTGVSGEDAGSVATDLASDLNAHASNVDAGSAGTFYQVLVADVIGPVVRLRTKNDTAPDDNWVIDQVTVSDGIGNAGLSFVHEETGSVAELPTVFTHGARVYLREPEDLDQGVEPLSQVVLRFVTENGGTEFGSGHWEEGVDYDLFTTLDGTTLPHALIYRTDNVTGSVTGKGYQPFFEWAPLDGSVPGLSWQTRQVGDDTSNRFPSFVTPINSDGSQTEVADRRVDAVWFYKDRLVIASGPDLSMSEVGNYDNFFRTTTQSLPDSERIDISSSSIYSAPIHDLTEVSGKLFAKTRRAILRIDVDQDGVLSPKTVGLPVVYVGGSGARSETDAALGGLLFVEAGGSYDRVKLLSESQGGVLVDFDLTDEVPRLLRSEVTALAWSPLYEAAFAMSRGYPTELWVGRVRRQGTSVAPPAWCRWTLSNDLEHLAVLGEDLFVLARRGDGIHLESMSLDVDLRDDGQDWAPRLDRRITELDLVTAPALSGGDTVIALPYDVESGRGPALRVLSRESADYGTALTVVSVDTTTPGSHSVTVDGDHTADRLLVGFVEAAVARPIYPVLKQRIDGGFYPMSSARYVVKRGYVTLSRSSYLDVTTLDAEGTGLTEALLDAAALEDRTFAFAVLSRPPSADVSFLASSHKPTTIAGLEWGINFVDKGRRVTL